MVNVEVHVCLASALHCTSSSPVKIKIGCPSLKEDQAGIQSTTFYMILLATRSRVDMRHRELQLLKGRDVKRELKVEVKRE